MGPLSLNAVVGFFSTACSSMGFTESAPPRQGLHSVASGPRVNTMGGGCREGVQYYVGCTPLLMRDSDSVHTLLPLWLVLIFMVRHANIFTFVILL